MAALCADLPVINARVCDVGEEHGWLGPSRNVTHNFIHLSKRQHNYTMPLTQ